MVPDQRHVLLLPTLDRPYEPASGKEAAHPAAALHAPAQDVQAVAPSAPPVQGQHRHRGVVLLRREQVAFNLFPALLSPVATQTLARAAGVERAWGTHLVTLYVWIVTAAATSVMAHTGYRSVWNDPGKHDLHHERAFSPRAACNFSTMGAFDWLHGTANGLSATETGEWRGQRDRQAALYEAERRSGVPLTEEQKSVVQQPAPDQEWVRKDV